MKNTKDWYASIVKPSFAPPAWVFGPVWMIIYALMAFSFGKLFVMFFHREVPFILVIPFALNVIFNLLYVLIMFRFRKFWLMMVDIVLVWITLAVAMYFALIYARYHSFLNMWWLVYMNIPYLLWVSFATVLQTAITRMNTGNKYWLEDESVDPSLDTSAK